MVGLIGIVKTALTPHGQISVHGELWDAVSAHPMQPGEEAEIISVNSYNFV